MARVMTPGVYIVGENAFPRSVGGGAAAIPAFIGFTERVEYKGQSLLNAPKRITSLAEYHQYFGFGPDLTGQFTITQGAPGAGDTAARKVESRRYMYYGL